MSLKSFLYIQTLINKKKLTKQKEKKAEYQKSKVKKAFRTKNSI